jgi:hypothetical protein
MLAGLNKGPGHTQVAWNSALIYDMIFTQHAAMLGLSYRPRNRQSIQDIILAIEAETPACGADTRLVVWDELALSNNVHFIVDSRC